MASSTGYSQKLKLPIVSRTVKIKSTAAISKNHPRPLESLEYLAP
ncbi:Hypothetical protein CpMEX30_0026 [Corynebacterium pseudotuberculosis]|nr:Hypothetical protein CpE19_0022 [Corynebacterium pseudotuberculosis]APQ53149.1 Hypothetical protein CpMEX30_0026 [Corynebacterium pseudotuberculosis]